MDWFSYGVSVYQDENKIKLPAKDVEVHVGPCSDPGSTPGVSTNKYMESIIIIILAVVFGWLLVRSRGSSRKLNRSRQNIIKRIKNRDHFNR